VALACPPLRALLEIMAHGRTASGEEPDGDGRARAVRPRHLLASAWYAARLDAQQSEDERRWTRHVQSLELFLDQPHYADVAARLGIRGRLIHAQRELARLSSPAYRASLVGTLGRQPLD
jgi:hypothetical protein